MAPGMVLHRDRTTLTGMNQHHGPCRSSDDKDDTVSPTDVAAGDTNLRHTLHVVPDVVVSAERLDCAGLQSKVLPGDDRVFAYYL